MKERVNYKSMHKTCVYCLYLIIRMFAIKWIKVYYINKVKISQRQFWGF